MIRDVVRLALVTKLKEGMKPPVGKHLLHYVVQVKDLATGEVYEEELQGVLTQGEPELVAPTVSISWTTVCAELLRSCGVVGDAALVKLREAVTVSLNESACLSEVLQSSGKSVAESVERIKREVIARLPKVQREGKCKVAQCTVEYGITGSGIDQRKGVVA